MKSKYTFTLILVLYIVGMIIFASLPGLSSVDLPKNYDKVFHFAEFFILTLILMKSASLFNIKNKLMIIFISAFLIAVITESVQLLIPSRSFSVWDLVFDTAGILTALPLKRVIRA